MLAPIALAVAADVEPAVQSGMGTTGRTLLVYKSVHHQNTAKVAQEMAGVLGAECTAPADCPYSRLAGYDLLGIGSGVYYGRVHDEVWRWVRELPDAHDPDLPVFLFTTSGLPFLAKLWHWPVKRILTQKRYRVVGEFACRGFDTWGPLWLAGGLNRRHPDERDLRRARDFAGRLAATDAPWRPRAT
jgi:flavodoxin